MYGADRAHRGCPRSTHSVALDGSALGGSARRTRVPPDAHPESGLQPRWSLMFSTSQLKVYGEVRRGANKIGQTPQSVEVNVSATERVGSPHWTISATGSSARQRKSAFFSTASPRFREVRLEERRILWGTSDTVHRHRSRPGGYHAAAPQMRIILTFKGCTRGEIRGRRRSRRAKSRLRPHLRMRL